LTASMASICHQRRFSGSSFFKDASSGWSLRYPGWVQVDSREVDLVAVTEEGMSIIHARGHP
jgi:hypothetical protein